MFNKLLSTLALLCAVSVAAVAKPSRIEQATTLTAPKPPVAKKPEVVKKPKPQITCIGCTTEETKTLKFFFKEGVTDVYALAMIMGSIKQESRFKPDVCEGGFITSWSGCTRGGFGLIQFTSAHRYYGLGHYARSTGQRPESMQTQLEYIITEPEWQAAERIFKKPGLPMHSYDYAGKIWLGYGIKGNRLRYAWQYVTIIS